MKIEEMNFSRRHALQAMSTGFGYLAFSGLSAMAAQSYRNPLDPKSPHFAPRAKRVIFACMRGGPSHVDTFDYKPELERRAGTPFDPDGKLQFFASKPGNCQPSFWKFRRHGQSGIWMSDLLPKLATCVDDMAFIYSMQSKTALHGPGNFMMNTGQILPGFPSMGSWVTYGLGSENENLPSFVVMVTGSVGGAGNSMWGSGFLPTIYQGVEFRASGDPVLFLSNPRGVKKADRRKIVDTINQLNREQLLDLGDPEIATRIGQYEMAYKMQSSVPDLMDTSGETEDTHALYGSKPNATGFANNCLLARRLVERGVRFVQLFDQGWDHHSNIEKSIQNKAKSVDQPIAALLKDLKQRGLLDDTLVICGSEFGRTPMVQGALSSAGRDHHKDCFSIWMAGGGVRGGVRVGESDDLGFSITKDPVSVHDFHATVLHLLGMDHTALTYKYQGRQFRLTDVAGEPVQQILS